MSHRVPWLASTLLVAACARAEGPAVAPPQTRGVQVENVRLTTWRGATVAARGTASSATLTVDGFRAEGVAIVLATGTTLRAPAVEGALDGRRLTATAGAEVATADGCWATTQDPVGYAGEVVRSSGPVRAGGCGFELDGQRLTYRVPERVAEVDGPVRTRLEARR